MHQGHQASRSLHKQKKNRATFAVPCPTLLCLVSLYLLLLDWVSTAVANACGCSRPVLVLNLTWPAGQVQRTACARFRPNRPCKNGYAGKNEASTCSQSSRGRLNAQAPDLRRCKFFNYPCCTSRALCCFAICKGERLASHPAPYPITLHGYFEQALGNVGGRRPANASATCTCCMHAPRHEHIAPTGVCSRSRLCPLCICGFGQLLDERARLC